MLLDRFALKKYQSGLKMVMYVAVRELFKCDVFFMHSLDKGLYCKIMTQRNITPEDISMLENKIKEIIAKDEKINRKTVTKKDAYDYYLKTKEYEKAGNILSLNSKTCTLYELHGFYNYFMGTIPTSTGELNKFTINYLGDNALVLSFPITTDQEPIKYKSQDMILRSFTEYGIWCQNQNVSYVTELNSVISNSKIKEFIKKNDIMMDNQIYELAYTIHQEHKKIVLLGGPSSSGKTTSTRKLSLYLDAIGLNPIYLSLDDYFKERLETPKLPNGGYDFESLNAIDLELFNTQLEQMLNGEKVKVPTFNFLTGKKEYSDERVIELKENDIILIEGLHCLNEELTSQIPADKKLKVYISPFMPLSIDRHNHISTVDIRLLRRIVRDNRTRGYDVVHTLKTWDDVRNGETAYVFPFTNEANVILNTAYVYEIGVLKIYVEPLLHSVPIDSKYYMEAQRLINFLQMFFPIPSEYISDDNILREFIGESYFE